MLKKESEILIQFVKEPWKKLTFKNVKSLSRKKSESYVYNSLKNFTKNGVLKKEKAGNVILYSLNWFLKTEAYVGTVAENFAWDQSNIPYKNLELIAIKIPTNFYIMLVTGSYANKTNRKDSDLDLVLIVEDCVEPKKIYSELRYDCEMSIPKIHLYVFKKSEFLSMLMEKTPNYGKEIIKKNLILYGGELYFKILKEAIENGFNG